jgi:hypothetical protein
MAVDQGLLGFCGAVGEVLERDDGVVPAPSVPGTPPPNLSCEPATANVVGGAAGRA